MPPTRKKSDDKASRLLAVFERQNDDGSYAFADEDVQELVPLLFLVSAETAKLDALPPSLQRALIAFAVRIGIRGDSTPKEIQRAIDGYYVENPVNPKLLAGLKRLLARR